MNADAAPAGAMKPILTDSEERKELPHIHVQSGDGYAKMWLGPPVGLVYSYGFSPRERRAAIEIVIRERAMMEKAWHDHFGT